MSNFAARGIFSWLGSERRSDRYGAFMLDDKPYIGDDRSGVIIDYQRLLKLRGQRVHVTCKVMESR